jgi:acyl carrier protein
LVALRVTAHFGRICERAELREIEYEIQRDYRIEAMVDIGGAMEAKQELLTRVRQISSEQLGIELEKITGESTWTQLGADSLDRLAMSRSIEDAFAVEIPHPVGERLDTVGSTVDHIWTLMGERQEFSNIRIEAATSKQQWADMSRIRTQVFATECGLSFEPLPRPGETGVWHFLARDNNDAVGTLSVVDTTRDRKLHQRYRLTFEERDRVARYAQLAILKPHRKRGIFKMLIETARTTVIRPNGFAVAWLLFPAAHVRSSMLTECLGFTAETPLLKTEFGSCHALTRRESGLPQVHWTEESFLNVETCPI